MAWRKVARVDDVPPGRTYFACPDERPVVLANREGRIYALSGICPHQRLPLEGAELWGGFLDCPWHHYQYDLGTGRNHYPRNVFPEKLRDRAPDLETFHVEVRNGDVWVDLPGGG